MITVIGHKKPDTDSAVAAVMFAKFLQSEKKEAEGFVAGKENNETNFLFSYFGIDLPQEKEEIREDEEVFLVDHNDLAQSIAKKENIIGVLDHHLLSGLKTDKTIFFRVEDVGSTSTLVYKMMKERGLDIAEKDAGLLLGGIISDTLNLTSPTTTTEDIDSLYELAKIAKIDTESFAEKMFEVKSDFSNKNIKDILTDDLKEYDFGNKKIGIGVAETTSLKYFQENEEEILKELKKIKEGGDYDALYFGVVDILSKNTYLYSTTKEEDLVVEKIFKVKKDGASFFLPEVTSRKKQIAPPISEFYNN